MAEVRLGQADDVRAAMRRIGPATVQRLSDETVLSVWSVTCRLKEHPEWFRVRGEMWELC